MIQRRAVLGLLAGAALTLCLSLPAFAPAADAAGPSPARKALEVSITRVLDCIKNPDYVNPATRAPLRRQIEDEVLHIFDFGEFSSRTVGPRWKEFTPDQKKRFSDAFADLLLTTYLNKVDGYNGEQVVYTGELANAAGNRVEVRTEITMKDGTRVPVAYRMMTKDSSWRVYDIIVENLSLVKNYRTQFQDILTSASPDELIARVKAKADEVRKQPAGK
ncbi:ABC transporter substrate-binding protein [uncultured Desulfovibrio sp.]|uniref:MlaC/ttg2D family ABC transporter substrate-binding protein n=1 Tax=uncultured Desulfovibrio sp. TaxID=167968 RepID=UPI002604D3EA|nr:ABC transporter substrate-binding protein [uncultured Desulfovibrio sp.]